MSVPAVEGCGCSVGHKQVKWTPGAPTRRDQSIRRISPRPSLPASFPLPRPELVEGSSRGGLQMGCGVHGCPQMGGPRALGCLVHIRVLMLTTTMASGSQGQTTWYL